MGNMVDSDGSFYISSSEFSTAPDVKYYDKYTYDSSSYTSHSRGKLGDATKETLSTFGSNMEGWYNDFADFISSNYSWLRREGRYNHGTGSGIFLFGRANGSATVDISTRVILIP